jgi:hypothetical protein
MYEGRSHLNSKKNITLSNSCSAHVLCTVARALLSTLGMERSVRFCNSSMCFGFENACLAELSVLVQPHMSDGRPFFSPLLLG